MTTTDWTIDIALVLVVLRQVKTHLNHVLSKLDLDGRGALVAGRGATA